MIMAQPTIFIIGTASLDTLHFAGQTVQTVGGAGLYTALAAQRAGAATGLFAPRPQPLPDRLRPVAERLAWLGPTIRPQAMPRLEIEHHGGGRATLVAASWGGESELTPADIPAAATEAAYVHIAALSSVQRQLAFWQALNDRRGGRPAPRLSIGTYARLVYGDTGAVRHLFNQADLFFMNDNEARGLFGSLEQAQTRPGALLFVTLGAAGALVIAGEQRTQVTGPAVPELDPTGAGDTFCGATLAGLAAGLTPVEAATAAVTLAGQTIQAAGPAALL
jgi:sugar/nucleoside kinase (ribokinase family)